MPRQDLLSKDGAQGAQEVIEGPGFGAQRLFFVVKDPVNLWAVEHSVYGGMWCWDSKACLFLEGEEQLNPRNLTRGTPVPRPLEHL